MSLQSNLANLVGAIGTDVKALQREVFDSTVDVAIVAGVATLDFALGHFFRLHLTANATLALVNAPAADCGVLQVTQAGGFTLALPGNATTISTIAYAASPGAGAIDMLGFMTMNAGASFRVAVSQPVTVVESGGATPADPVPDPPPPPPTTAGVTLSPSPANGLVFTQYGINSTAEVTVTATRTGMVGPLTQLWERISGDLIDFYFSAGAATCSFQFTNDRNSVRSGVFRHTTLDAGNGNAAHVEDVTVTLEVTDDR